MTNRVAVLCALVALAVGCTAPDPPAPTPTLGVVFTVTAAPAPTPSQTPASAPGITILVTPATPVPTEVVEVQPTATATTTPPAPTDTPAPTATAVPTSTPEPTPTQEPSPALGNARITLFGVEGSYTLTVAGPQCDWANAVQNLSGPVPASLNVTICESPTCYTPECYGQQNRSLPYTLTVAHPDGERLTVHIIACGMDGGFDLVEGEERSVPLLC